MDDVVVRTKDAFAQLADQGRLIAYFGYGSLVNPFTHRTEIITYGKARLHGWHRRWRGRPEQDWNPVAFLSSHPVDGSGAADTGLDGLLIFDKIDSLPALDWREAGYDRRMLVPGDYDSEIDVPDGCPVYVYEGRVPVKPVAEHVVLHSYLDAVLQGYHMMYGPDGVTGFIETTGAFDTPVLMDRARPRYPRAISLDPVEKVLIDDATRHLNFVEDGR